MRRSGRHLAAAGVLAASLALLPSPGPAARAPVAIGASDPFSPRLVARFAAGTRSDDAAVIEDAGPAGAVVLAQANLRRALVLDIASGRTLAVISLPTGARHVAVDPTLRRIYLPDEHSNTLQVVFYARGWNLLVMRAVPVGRIPHAAAVDPRTHRVYVTDENDNAVSVVDGSTLRVTQTAPVGRLPGGIALDPRVGIVYVAVVLEDRVAILDAATGRVPRSVRVGREPTHLTADPTAGRAYVTNTTGDTLSAVDGARGTAAPPVAVGTQPYNVVADGPRGLIVVASANSPFLRLLDARTLRVRRVMTLDIVPRALGIDPRRRLLIVGGNEPRVETYAY